MWSMSDSNITMFKPGRDGALMEGWVEWTIEQLWNLEKPKELKKNRDTGHGFDVFGWSGFIHVWSGDHF